LPFLFLINNTEKGEFSSVSLRQHYLDQVMGMISARYIKAPRILKSEDKYKWLVGIEQVFFYFLFEEGQVPLSGTNFPTKRFHNSRLVEQKVPLNETIWNY